MNTPQTSSAKSTERSGRGMIYWNCVVLDDTGRLCMIASSTCNATHRMDNDDFERWRCGELYGSLYIRLNRSFCRGVCVCVARWDALFRLLLVVACSVAAADLGGFFNLLYRDAGETGLCVVPYLRFWAPFTRCLPVFGLLGRRGTAKSLPSSSLRCADRRRSSRSLA